MTARADELYRRALDWFGERVRAVKDEQWHLPTPCTEWDVRVLVNHMAYEALWVPLLFEGKTIEEVGDRLEGDVLGDDAKAAWDAAAEAAAEAVSREGALDRTVHLSFGDSRGESYAMELFADGLIHGWDLAQGIGYSDRMDAELVEACAAWFGRVENAYRAAGLIAERPPVPNDADDQTNLLAMFGRTASWRTS